MKGKKGSYNPEANTGASHHIQVTVCSLRFGVKKILYGTEVQAVRLHPQELDGTIWTRGSQSTGTGSSSLWPLWGVCSLGMPTLEALGLWSMFYCLKGLMATPSQDYESHTMKLQIPQHSWARYAKPCVRFGPWRLCQRALRVQGSWRAAPSSSSICSWC